MGSIERTVSSSDCLLAHFFAQVEGAIRPDYRDQLLVRGLCPFGEIALSCNAAGHSRSVVPVIKGIGAKRCAFPGREFVYPCCVIVQYEAGFAVLRWYWLCECERLLYTMGPCIFTHDCTV